MHVLCPNGVVVPVPLSIESQGGAALAAFVAAALADNPVPEDAPE